MWIGLDIGGANLKASDGERTSQTRPYPIWKHPRRLAGELQSLLSSWSGWQGLAVTMTAELADCFETKAAGVAHILAEVEKVAEGRQVAVWQTAGEFVDAATAREFPILTAAANWHALATWAGRMCANGSGLLIDIGSTTTDIIPVEDGLPNTLGATDVARLISGELVYLGVKRTPLCGLASSVSRRGRPCPLAAELFATTQDIFLMTGEMAEVPEAHDTADGRPETRPAAHNRLAHMICCDRDEVSLDEAAAMARELRERVIDRISSAVERVASRLPGACVRLLTSGEGEFLANEAVAHVAALSGAPAMSLTQAVGGPHSTASCAYALARLAAERL